MLRLLNISQREKNIAIVILVFLFLFAAYSFVFTPLLEKLSVLNREIEAKELKLIKNQKIFNREKFVANDYKKYEQYLRQKASDEQEMASVLSEIEAIAHQINIQISDIRPQRVKKEGFYNSFIIEVDAEASLKDITRFIYTLQSPPHLLRAEKLRLEKQIATSPTLKCYILVTKILIPQ
jgi:Tfp pilus assembly protein PilO